MEITQELKRRYFALYWNQKVVKDSICIGEDPEYVAEAFGYSEDVFKVLYLELKDLRNITDEDAIEIAKIIDGKKHRSVESIKKDIADQMFWVRDCYVVDFFRSKGYALPYMGIPVSKWIEEGVVKLKEV